ncbi:MAG: ABC transporter ATP-binding protein [Gemmatimonadota bacterium]|nr:MAG: ABC transporter ATP-binding protein [Gemmatimonadota bacterium]
MKAAVSLDGLTRDFGELRAVDGLTFDVAPGELFGIVGPDGAGKTTTLRMLAGVLRPSSGDASVAGVSIARDPEGVKHRIAYMSQRFGLYTDLTVRENIEFYADLYQVPRPERPPRLERLYAFSGLGPFQDRLAGQLSGGMKQKLGLCAALIHEPDILLLDEPTFGVDPISRRDLWLIIHEMVASGVTVIVSTAYLDEAERCDRVALFHKGKVAVIERPDALQRRLHDQVLAVRTDQPRGARDLLRGHPVVRQAVLFGDVVHVTLAGGAVDWPCARDHLTVQGIAVLEESPVEPSLEDVFIDLVQGREAADD